MNDQTRTLGELKAVMADFVNERQWQRFHHLKNLSMSLAIEAAELMEHAQWIDTEQSASRRELNIEAICEELADVTSYVLAIANSLEIDLASSLARKMEKNRRKYPVGAPNTAQGRPTLDAP